MSILPERKFPVEVPFLGPINSLDGWTIRSMKLAIPAPPCPPYAEDVLASPHQRLLMPKRDVIFVPVAPQKLKLIPPGPCLAPRSWIPERGATISVPHPVFHPIISLGGRAMDSVQHAFLVVPSPLPDS
jgi:hypothetical protein